MPPAKRTAATPAADKHLPTTVDTASYTAPLQPLDLVPIQAALQIFTLLEADLSMHLIERDEAIRAALCALIAGQNMVLIGPPGTAKSYLVYEGVMAAQRSGDPNLSSSKVVIEGNDKLRAIRKRLRQLLDQAKAEDRKTDRILKIGQRVREMNEAVAALILGTPSEEVF